MVCKAQIEKNCKDHKLRWQNDKMLRWISQNYENLVNNKLKASKWVSNAYSK